MAQRRHHYERAFEEFLRTRRIPYVAVDEARKALLPEGAPLRVQFPPSDGAAPRPDQPSPSRALKSFDFVIYASPRNLLLDVKGRKVAPRARRASLGGLSGRLENWVTRDDIDSLACWERLFGPEFQAGFLFIYWCDAQPPDCLFQEIIEYRGWWYALRAVTLADYVRHMKVRSPRWGTVDLSTDAFERISQPFTSGFIAPDAPAADHPAPRNVGEPPDSADPGPSSARRGDDWTPAGTLHHVADPPGL